MSPLKSNRLAWSVAVAALALWASSASVTWGQVAADATGLFAQGDPDSESTIISEDNQLADSLISPCPTSTPPPAVAQLLPPNPVAPAATGTFSICGANPGIEREIEQLIAGRGFSATLNSHGGGCAELTIRPNAQLASGSSSSNLSVSLGSGQMLSILIVSDPGGTHATITVR